MIPIISKQELPKTNIPIVIIGAGGIVKDAHLPAYKKAGFDVIGIYDLNPDNSKALSEQYNIKTVCHTIESLVALGKEHHAIFDVTVPASEIANILPKLPDNSAVLIQKPMGENLQNAEHILSICKSKNLTAAMNFQLRFAPFVNAARSIINSGAIGEVYDMKVKLCTYTPWHLWDFLAKISRVEILYHSIHYIDVIRSFLGDPKGIMAKTVKHPSSRVASTRSSILFDYGDEISASINTNHDHNFGKEHQESFIKWEGTKGVIIAKMGLLLDYPHGVPDAFEYCVLDEHGKPEWHSATIEGSWFPDAFIGTMSNIMQFVEGSQDVLISSVEDAIKTMEIVEIAYQSSDSGSKTLMDNI
ncbi:Gfo/Idh/MocA family oxidoreductase [Sabulilitoribacter arenilitoris]|uniref:Gfo/Idh/MocA family oxidoreductase n=1 Tax=Wocania arenilitoris TaxID=2044858 RepID=A0AAE3EMU7_9FLAO|nr:Gfo/Idh/MocA family oxidoreductase [Wocania arenilitoris]MCF7567777.1 Gfo/Idh/MocA family oxidoreductase [Wocania arenilitoris]